MAYRGKNKRVLGRSGSGIPGPESISGLTQWFDATLPVYYTAGSDFTVTQLRDRKGLTNHYNAAGAAKPIASRPDNLENFLTYSDTLTNAAWTAARCTVLDNQIANPINGAVDTELITEDSTNNTHVVSRTSTLTLLPSTQYRMTLYAQSKLATSSISIQFTGAAFTGTLYAHFDLPKGMIVSTDAGVTAQIDRAGPGWYKLTAWCTTNATGGAATPTIYITRPAGTTTYLGDGASGVYLWRVTWAYPGSATESLGTTSAANYAGFDYGVSGIDVVPSKASYWAILNEWAGYLTTYMNASGLSTDASLAATYYEGELGRYMLADFNRTTAPYYTYADENYHAYRNYYCSPASFGVPGYWAFGEGFAERYIRRQLNINFVTNGKFEGTTSGWGTNNCTNSAVAGGQSGNCLQVTNVGAFTGGATQTITGWKGTLYSFSIYFKKGTCANGRIMIGSTSGAADLYDSGSISDAGWTLYSGTFTTPTSSVTTVQSIFVRLQNNTAVDTQTSLFDEFTISTVQAKTDLETLCANAAFHGTTTVGYNTIEGNYANVALDGHNLSREWSYCVYNYVQLGRLRALTTPEATRRDFCFTDLFRIVDWWYTNTCSYFRPFMCALLCRSLIAYYDYVATDSRIIPALKKMAELIMRQYIPAYKTCYYTDRDGTGQVWGATEDRLATGVPDLNQLISPVFGWLWKNTGSRQYRDFGDNLFTGGIAVYSAGSWVSGAYLGTQSASNPAGKQYNQQHDWGRRYTEWAEYCPTLPGNTKFIFDGVANAMSATNGVTAQPCTDFIVVKQLGDTTANRTLFDTTGRALARYSTTGNIELNAGSALNFANTRGNKEIISVVTNNATSTIRLNRKPVASGAAGANVPGATLYLGQNALGAEFMKGDFFEHIRYNRALTAAEQTTVETYLGVKHTISLYNPPVDFIATTYGTVGFWARPSDNTKMLNSGSTPAIDTDPVMTLNDSSSGAYNMTQGTVAYRPVYKTGIVNTWNILRCAGTKGFGFSNVQSGAISKNQPGLTFVIALNTTSFAGNQNLFRFDAGGAGGTRAGLYLLNTNGNLVVTGMPQDGGTSDTQFWTSGISTGQWYVIVVRFDFVGKTMKAWINNVVKGSAAEPSWPGTNSTNTDATSGENPFLFNFYGGSGLVGDCAEAIVYQGALSDGVIATLSTTLGYKFGLTI